MKQAQPYIISLLILGAIIVGLIYLVRYLDSRPSKYDELAQCLNDSGVEYYAAYWCPNCENQSAMFGNARQHLPRTECGVRGASNSTQAQACQEAGITAYPTWDFPEAGRIEGVQEVATLAALANCPLPEGEETASETDIEDGASSTLPEEAQEVTEENSEPVQ